MNGQLTDVNGFKQFYFFLYGTAKLKMSWVLESLKEIESSLWHWPNQLLAWMGILLKFMLVSIKMNRDLH